jgi:hypothetical protein
MEAWITVIVAAIVALSTLGATWLQNRHSSKRFETELKKTKEADLRQRRWEVRSKPLFDLRDELAHMAALQNEVVDAARKMQGEVDVNRKQAEARLKKALQNWDAYRAEGNLLKSKFIQSDAELFGKVSAITKDYIRAYENVWKSGELKIAELKEAENDSNKIWPKVMEVQELINKKLEEL